MGIALIVREAIRGLLRTGAVGMVSVLAIAASLLVLGVFGQAAVGGFALASAFRERVEVDVYLRSGVSRSKALALAADLESLPQVASTVYLDKDAASAEFRSMYGEGLLEGLSENPLPASIRVRLMGNEDAGSAARVVSEAASERPEVESVEAGEEWLTAFDQTLDRVLIVGGVLGGVLCLACFFAVGNTAKLMVLSQREVIEVMRIVGATGRAVRMTFLLGGTLQGLAGGGLAAIAFYLGRGLWSFWVPESSPLPDLIPELGAIVLGCLLGLLGSWASLNRVLRAVEWRP